MITFQQMFELIKQKDKADRPIPFDVEFVTFEKKTKRGGDVKSLKRVVYLWPKTKGHQNNPNLFINGTINVTPAGGTGITTIHLILIRRLNGQIVT